MDVIILQIFVSLVLVASSLILFFVSARQRDHEHADRLALLPLQQEDGDGLERGSVPSSESAPPRK